MIDRNTDLNILIKSLLKKEKIQKQKELWEEKCRKKRELKNMWGIISKIKDNNDGPTK